MSPKPNRNLFLDAPYSSFGGGLSKNIELSAIATLSIGRKNINLTPSIPLVYCQPI